MNDTARSKGTTRGRYGVTRDPDGSLSVIWGWPWFWRYPVAVIGASAVWLFLIDANFRQEWQFWLVLGGSTLFLLSIAYELLLALMGIGLLWGAYHLISSSNGGFASTAQVVATAFLIIGVYTLLQRSDETRRALAELTTRLNNVEKRLERVHYEIRQSKEPGRRPLGEDEY